MSLTLTELQTLCQKRTAAIFEQYLKTPTAAPTLQEAMAYSVFNGGKRLRPLLVYAAGYATGASWENLDPAAAAIELIHSYSLIHDDLPAMDNADLRRGKLTCHKQYNEAMAILAGDALQTLAFDILATHPCSLNNEQRLAMIKTLAHASGLNGIAAGQTLDIQGVRTLAELDNMYTLKTGVLLMASVTLGALAANPVDHGAMACLEKFAQHLGLAYQIQDDLLDVNDSAVTGKSQGIDIVNQKTTYVSLLGMEKTRERVERLFAEALVALKPLGEKAEVLRVLAEKLVGREK